MSPTCREVHCAIHQLKDGKAPGLCNITVEMLKADGVEWLTGLAKGYNTPILQRKRQQT